MTGQTTLEQTKTIDEYSRHWYHSIAKRLSYLQLANEADWSALAIAAIITVKIQVRVIPDTLSLEELGEARSWFSHDQIFASTPTSSRGSQTGASLLFYKQTSVFHVPRRQLAKFF